MLQDIIFAVNEPCGFITLNRPGSLNALTYAMTVGLRQQLELWQEDPRVHVVVLGAAGGSFCAGGDVRWIYAQRSDLAVQLEFFAQEYDLNQFIHDYPKPIISLMQGYTMGGGVGVGLHASHPVASTSFVFAMPETTIGFFPDIGSSYLMSALPHGWSSYLALMGHRLQAHEAARLGLVHAVVPQEFWPMLRAQLMTTDWSKDPHASASAVIAAWTQATTALHAPNLPEEFSKSNSLEQLIDELTDTKTETTLAIRELILKKAPLSLYVTFEQRQRAVGLSLFECLKMDRILVEHFLQDHDFYEGVRALLLDRDNKPNWQPHDFAAVSVNLLFRYFDRR